MSAVLKACTPAALFAATGMESRYMIVELIATLARFPAVAARVNKRAGEVNVLHVFAQVGAVGSDLAANGAPMSAVTLLR